MTLLELQSLVNLMPIFYFFHMSDYLLLTSTPKLRTNIEILSEDSL